MTDNSDATSAVGYGRPPAEHRFAKGRSGNPNGRPKKSKNTVPVGQGLDFGTQPANRMLLEEAYRNITIREGEKVLELPVIKAVFRALGVSALKGNRLAQKTMAELVGGIEDEDRRLRVDHFAAACAYKWNWEQEIEHARRTGRPEPEPLPHPDDVIVDTRRAEVRYAGPMTKEEKLSWDRQLSRRQEAQDEVTEFSGRHKRARKQSEKELWLREWHYEQRIFDLINDALPERYKAKLCNRSWHADASRESKTLKEYRKKCVKRRRD